MFERFVDAGGVRARVLEEGVGDPVLLVHGIGGFAENWTFTLPALAAAGFRAIAVDLPGHGQTARAAGVRYFDPEDPYYARFLLELVDALGIERAHLAGHSLGGAVVTTSAVCSPGRWSSLVLVAPGGYGRRVALSFRLSSLTIARVIAALAPAAFIRDTVLSCFADPSSAPDWMFEKAERYARAGAAVEFTRVLHQTITLSGPRSDLIAAWDPRVRAIRHRTLVLWGRLDIVVPITDLPEVRERLPHAEVGIIEDAGHLVQIERAAEFNRAVVAFLKTA